MSPYLHSAACCAALLTLAAVFGLVAVGCGAPTPPADAGPEAGPDGTGPRPEAGPPEDLGAEGPGDGPDEPRFRRIEAGNAGCFIEQAIDPAAEIQVSITPCRESDCEVIELQDRDGESLRVPRIEARGEGDVPLVAGAIRWNREEGFVVILDASGPGVPVVRAVARAPISDSATPEKCGRGGGIAAGPGGAAFGVANLSDRVHHVFHYRAGASGFEPSIGSSAPVRDFSSFVLL